VERRGRKHDARKPSRQIGLPQFIVEPNRIDLSSDTRRHVRHESGVALALDLDGTPHVRRAGVVPEHTSVGGPNEERNVVRRVARARGDRFLRGLCQEATRTLEMDCIKVAMGDIPG
jgi:hypothetical protein